MQVVLVTLFVFVSSAKCINENYYVEQGRHNSNHPPSLEDDNPIQVTIIQDDAVLGKTVNPETDISTNIEDVINTKENIEVITTELTETDIEVKTSATTSRPTQPVKLKSHALEELQIPVAVIYDSEPVRYRKPQVSAPLTVIKPTARKLKQTRRRPVQNKTSTESDSLTERTETKPESSDIVEHDTLNEESKQTKSKNEYVIKPRFERINTTKLNPQPIEILTKTGRSRKRDPVVPIIEEANYVFAHNGNFHYSYEGGDGTKAHSEGQLRSFGDKSTGEAVSGGFSYTDKEGNDFSLSYTADENGYRPIGAHLPTPPPIPPAIARALAYLATATSPEPVTKPSIKKTLET